MSKIKLPKPLRGIIHNAFSLKGYEIMEAYVDEMEYKIKDGLGKLRNFLGISDSESVCDCFCKIRINGIGERTFIIEDKKSKHTKRFKDAKRQLELTNNILENKKIDIDFAIICRVSPEEPFKTRQDQSQLPPLKVICLSINGNQVFLNNSNSNKIPLLYA